MGGVTPAGTAAALTLQDVLQANAHRDVPFMHVGPLRACSGVLMPICVCTEHEFKTLTVEQSFRTASFEIEVCAPPDQGAAGRTGRTVDLKPVAHLAGWR